MTETKPHVWTVGHSTQTLDDFVVLLRRHEISVVADVRSAPYSRFSPHFNKDALQRGLKANGIKYVFLGRELGARSDDPTCYEHGRVQYARLAKTELFQQGLDRLIRGASEHRIAIMCAEKEPLECHRTILVARALVARGVEVDHILASGQVESHGDAMVRLLRVVGIPREDLFRSEDELIEEALARQEERIAYVDEKLAGEAEGRAS
ncbi:MAG: DUF488 family protein [Proteobacteria bacterium]|nr:DUF488 family protein [Pseudomonadota bacterium]